MTDFDAMLTAARALHDRDPNDPGACLTCHDGNGTRTTFPCPTARALGATGRSEWATVPQGDGAMYTDQYGNTMWHDYTDRDTCGNQYENDICHLQRGHDGACSYSPINAPRCSPQCAREAGHPGIHVHPDGTRR